MFLIMRGQLLHHCKGIISSKFHLLGNKIGLPSLTCSQFRNQKCLLHYQHGSFHQKGHRRSISTTSFVGVRERLLPGNLVQSDLPDIDLPEMPFHELIFKRLDIFKNNIAMSEFLTDKSYTYGDMKKYAIKVGSALTRLGYKKGDTILNFSTNNIESPLLMLVASCLGLIYSSANPTFTEGELARQLNDCKAKAIFTIPELAQTTKAATESKEVSHKLKNLFVFGELDGFYPFQKLLDDDGKEFPDVSINPKADLFLLPYSSGTTGFPKGVMLTHYNVVSNVLQINNTLPANADDNIIGLLPLFHVYGMVAIQYISLFGGSHLHFLPRFEPEIFLKCLQDSKISIAHLVPPLILFLAKNHLVSNFDLTNLRLAVSGAAPLGKELTFAFKDRFPDVILHQGYGMTELSPVATIDRDGTICSVGPPMCNTLAKVAHLETGENLGPNQEGEICIKGPHVMNGYLNNKKATDEMVTPSGWLHTGDIGYYDEKGLLYVSDRLKELIKYKGNQIAPAELESLLFGHEAVQDVAVIGIPDTEAGEIPRAFVVRKPDSAVVEEDIIKFVEERVSPIKKLRGGVEFVTEIPKTPSGKILRRLLKTS